MVSPNQQRVWLHNAVTLNVKNLVLDVRLASGSHLTLPFSLLRCTSLESLVMLFYDNGIGILKTPSSFNTFRSPCSLKELKQKSVRIDESFGNWISSHCKLLEKIQLEDIKGTTCIVITDWRFDSPNNRGLQLSTPKLKFLYWKGNLLNLSVAENMKNLQSSFILLEPFSGITSANRSLFHAIRAVCNCHVPVLYDHSRQDLFKLGCLPISLPDLSYLSLIVIPIYVLALQVRCRTMRRWELRDMPILTIVTIKVISQQKE
ncbi:hypothetical protein TIFTF001_024978 [Ficus carica]|uniref:Uncharacterized protein n=1 Tax=Ficus carica TaxID=3494 RepID=A0AA88B117_FICCA|nr:hypothetical protein TIFTF001_024978 [Ficus carica]